MQSRLTPVLGLFAGLFVHSALPRGAFGAWDVAVRAAITGCVAGMTCLLILTLNKRRGSPR